MLGFYAIGETAIAEILVSTATIVSWTGGTLVLTTSVGAYVGAMVDLTTRYVTAHDGSLGEYAIGEVGSVETFYLPPNVRLQSPLAAYTGQRVNFTADLRLAPISIEPITRERRTTVQVLES